MLHQLRRYCFYDSSIANISTYCTNQSASFTRPIQLDTAMDLTDLVCSVALPIQPSDRPCSI
jgi:hypothetical protein